MKTMVLSGINLCEGGPLSIYYDCLDEIRAMELDKKYKIIIFVHKRELFKRYEDIVHIEEIPEAKKSYFLRLYYEYVYFYKYSLKHSIDTWVSLHDITPRVRTAKVFTYCHNPSPFMKRDISKLKYGTKNVAFAFFYKYLYRVNIKSATAVIVQQDWMRQEFLKMYPIDNVIVARPKANVKHQFIQRKNNEKTIFIYAAFPRFFKNFEVIFKACNLLEKENGNCFEVWVTIDGTENNYSAELVKKYKDLKSVKWLGIKPRDEIFTKYEESDCLIFPSLLETWGLPISEYKSTGKSMLLADLPYAHETLGYYEKAIFFNPESSEELKDKMKSIIEKNPIYSEAVENKVEEPYASNWKELLEIILE